MKRFLAVGLFTLVFGLTATAGASLTVTGTNLIYDSVRDITWYDAPGVYGSWGDAKTWAQNLAVTVNGASITGWRLPSAALPTPITAADLASRGGSICYTDHGEMGYLDYDELGNTYNPTTGRKLNALPVNLTPFSNLLHPGNTYWYDAAYDATHGLTFTFSDGSTGPFSSTGSQYFIAVHSGDVSVPAGSGGGGAAVPIPPSALLLAPALVSLVAMRKRFRK